MPTDDPRDALHAVFSEAIAAVDFTGYTVQYPPLACWGRPDEASILRAWGRVRERHAGLYVHVPYCPERCGYCRYCSHPLPDPRALEDFLDGLAREADRYAPRVENLRFATLYVGGGTPTLLDAEALDRLFELLEARFDLRRTVQRTVEATPSTIERRKLAVLRRRGVDRLTLGVQSLTPRVLAAVGRTQTAAQVRAAVRGARAEGIRFVNVDLMAGLPGETLATFGSGLERVLELAPDMIHVHGFYPTPYTRYWKDGGRPSRTEMDGRAAMQALAERRLREAGYRPVPYDAAARDPGARNVQLADAIEWNASFLGLGPAAAGHSRDGWRTVNLEDPAAWLRRLRRGRLPVASGARLRRRDEWIYFVTAALRYGRVSRRRFRRLFGVELERCFPGPLAALRRRGRLETRGDELRLRADDVGGYLLLSKYFFGRRVVERLRQVARRQGLPAPRGGVGPTRYLLL